MFSCTYNIWFICFAEHLSQADACNWNHITMKKKVNRIFHLTPFHPLSIIEFTNNSAGIKKNLNSEIFLLKEGFDYIHQ